jgi:putative hemolysin
MLLDFKIMPFQRTQDREIRKSKVGNLQKTFDFPFRTGDVPIEEISEGRYTVRFARTSEEIDAALRLRFSVFNLELNEGLDSSFLTERDEDEFDSTCHHLIVVERETNKVVGTYRLRTLEMAKTAGGFYSSGEFRVEDLPVNVLAQSLEIGRSCIAREHRNTRVLFLLWKGLALYVRKMRKRYLFGCCSLFTLDCSEGKRAAQKLREMNALHPEIRVDARQECQCRPEDFLTPEVKEEAELPRLFNTYLRIGAKICGEPAIDRQFKTIDFFVLFDIETIEERYYRMFFSSLEHLRN